MFLLVSLGTVACSNNAPTNTSGTGDAAAPAASQPASPQPAGTLVQVMRSILFPNSNIIFDTQTKDPGAPPPKPTDTAGAGATIKYAAVYTGWQVVENSAVALADSANLIMIPGRTCENGKPVPVDQDDFKKYAQGLRDAGRAALKAAQSKNLDAMVEVSGTVADACAACHEVYRDIGPAGGPERCAVPPR
jgi:hypothetical protein